MRKDYSVKEAPSNFSLFSSNEYSQYAEHYEQSHRSKIQTQNYYPLVEWNKTDGYKKWQQQVLS